MKRLAAESQGLRAALLPLTSYTKNSRAKIDLADPKAAARFRHVQEVETALKATVAYFNAADKILNPAPSAFAQRILSHLNQPHMQARLAHSSEDREVIASITAHHLPRNPDLDGLTR